MQPETIYSAKQIFTGETWLTEHALVTRSGKIVDIVQRSSLGSDRAVVEFGDDFIAPALVDLQIYGAQGRLLAVYPEADAIFKLRDYCYAGGAAWFQPTVPTASYTVFKQCVDAVREYWKQGGQGVPGLHIEGPWINPVKRGAHVTGFIHSPSLEQVTELLEYGRGAISMITLAPEVCSPEIIGLIQRFGIVVSAGHSNASYEQALAGFDLGIRAVTHLYNAMSPLQHRAPGLVGATLDDPRAHASIIPDGYHVDFAAIRIAKAAMKERLFVITDAVTETPTGYYPHKRVGDKYESEGILSGSALDMAMAMRNLVEQCRIDTGEALRMCSLYPARVMGMDDRIGLIRPGYLCNLVVMDPSLEVKKIIVE